MHALVALALAVVSPQPAMAQGCAVELDALVPDSNPARVEWAGLIKEQLEPQGYCITNHLVGWGEIIPRTFGHDALYDDDPTTLVPTYAFGGYDILYVGYGWGADPGMDHLVAGFPDNFYNYDNAAFEASWLAYLGSAAGERQAYATQVQAQLWTDPPSAVLLYPKDFYYFTERLNDLDPFLLSARADLYRIAGVSNDDDDDCDHHGGGDHDHHGGRGYGDHDDDDDDHHHGDDDERRAITLSHLIPYMLDGPVNPYFIETYGDSVATNAMHAALGKRRPIPELDVVDPDIARYWHTDDGLTYTVYLDRCRRWHDGYKITADEVAGSLRAAAIVYPWLAASYDLDSVRVLDRYTLELTLTGDDFRAFNQTFAGVTIVPTHLIGDDPNAWPYELEVGAGPYELVESEAPYAVTLKRFERYDKCAEREGHYGDGDDDDDHEHHSSREGSPPDFLVTEFLATSEEAIERLNGGENVIVDGQFLPQFYEGEINGKLRTSGFSSQEISLNRIHPAIDESCEAAAFVKAVQQLDIIGPVYGDPSLATKGITTWIPDHPGFDPAIAELPLETCPPTP